MDHEVVPRKRPILRGTTSMVRVTKIFFSWFMGPSLGVNRMWTMKNDHAPKSGGVNFFNIINHQNHKKIPKNP
jgi:hypothetical protein